MRHLSNKQGNLSILGHRKRILAGRSGIIKYLDQ
jgi:hypothetical protein